MMNVPGGMKAYPVGQGVATHWPDRQCMPSPQAVQSATVVHSVVPVPGAQTRHALAESVWPSARQAPSSRHIPPCSTWLHPVTGSQASVVQTNPSSHVAGVPPHALAVQTSLSVQMLPSSQGVPFATAR
jgi:hypothetical protein